MASITHHRDKKTGAIYRYRVESYWDKEKKAPRNKQVYLGKVDPHTGELVSSKTRKGNPTVVSKDSNTTLISKIVGPYLILEQISKKLKLDHLISKCFGQEAPMIQSLVYFLVQKGLALSRVEPWSMASLHPFADYISSQNVSELLRSVDEAMRQRFFALWLSEVAERDCLCYDITYISSYGRNNEYLHWGYNRDGEPLEQVNVAMLFGQNYKYPVYYRRLPGNISDVATLKKTLGSLNFLKFSSMHLVLDRGFYSQANVDALYKDRHKFTIAVPAGRKWVESIFDEHYEFIASPRNYLKTGKDEALYASTSLYKWGNNNHRLYVHVYYNAEHAANNYDAFTRKLIALKAELLSGKPIQAHEKLYERYFIIKQTPKRGLSIEFNDEEILKFRKRYSGFFCIISNKIKQADEALSVYRGKDIVENCFDDLKNHLDMKRLRVHGSEAMDTRLFLQFLALIYVSEIRQVSKTNDKLKYLSVREVMEHMESLSEIKSSAKAKVMLTETSPLQRQILEAFEVEVQT